jgi:2-haloacid dehalogenase
MASIDTVVFDIGNVLIRWDPRFLYRSVFPDAERMEWFLTHVCSPEWNQRQDAGRGWDEATAELVERFPGFESEIRAFYERWDEMVPGPVEGMPELFAAVGRAGYRRAGVSNFAADTFEKAKRRFAFLGEIEPLALSGALGLMKPDPAIFRWLIDRGVDPMRAIYVDDSPANVAVADDLGFHAVLFRDAEGFADHLAERGVRLAPLDDAA